MSKKIAILLTAVSLMSASAFASEEGGNTPPPTNHVPDTSSTMMLLVPALGALAFCARKTK